MIRQIVLRAFILYAFITLVVMSLAAAAQDPSFDAGSSAVAADASSNAPPIADAAPDVAVQISTEDIIHRTSVDPIATAKRVVDDVRAGRWRYAVSGLLALVMFGLAKARDKTKWFSGDRGGAILVFVFGMMGALATALPAGKSIDLWLFLGALSVTFTAVGGVTWCKRLIWPKDKKAAQ